MLCFLVPSERWGCAVAAVRPGGTGRRGQDAWAPLTVAPGHSLSPGLEIEQVWAAGTVRPARSGTRLAAPLVASPSPPRGLLQNKCSLFWWLHLLLLPPGRTISQLRPRVGGPQGSGCSSHMCKGSSPTPRGWYILYDLCDAWICVSGRESSLEGIMAFSSEEICPGRLVG